MLAQFVTDRIAATRAPAATVGRRRSFRALRTLRRLLLAVHDPLVQYTLCGTRIAMPLSHDLPLIRCSHPEYGVNLGRLAGHVGRAYPGASMIDVGANVGDSVAIVRSASSMPVLCIEGDPAYAAILRRNLAVLPGVEMAQQFVGESGGEIAATVDRAGGTGVISRQRGSPGGGLRMATLERILEGAPRYRDAKLLKIDTDGFDAAVLRGSREHLRRARPVVFFEDDPALLARAGDAPDAAFAELRSAGYRGAVVYDRYGNLVACPDVADAAVLGDLHAYCASPEGPRYFDVAAFHRDDDALWRSFCESERARRRI